jgi:hypothetical protein
VFVSLRMVALPPDREADRDAVVAAVRAAAVALPGLRSSWVAPVTAGVTINAGSLVWRATFGTEAEALAAPLTPAWRTGVAPALEGAQVSGVGYRVTRSAVRPAGPGIWRALVFRVMPHGFPETAAQLEAGLLLLPQHVPAIRSWALNPVSAVEGPKAYTHVWEQEFDSVEGLTGDYMRAPVHWGLVDSWFDADCPQYVVDPHVIQVVGDIDETVMA